MKMAGYRAMGALVLASAWGLTPGACGQGTDRAAGKAMPAAQQNALVQTYCAVCHNDAYSNGGLSLEHFDGAHPDPGVAAMMASKLKAKALGASGKPLPDTATQDALLNALVAESAGAGRWVVSRSQGAGTRAALLSASIVREASSNANGGEPDLYRLTVTCREDTGEGGMQLAWSPGVPEQGRAMSAVVDGKARFEYTVEGSEKMGNGTAVTSGPGAVMLYGTRFPAQTLTVSNLFREGTVAFPFGELDQTSREALSTCFGGSGR